MKTKDHENTQGKGWQKKLDGKVEKKKRAGAGYEV